MGRCSDFVSGGLPTKGPLAQKLWLVAKTLHMNPFSDSLQSLTIPQLDWIVEMIAKDNPDKIRISRGSDDGMSEGERASVSMAAVWNTKRGKAKDEAISLLFSSEQLAKLKALPRRKKIKTQLYVNPDFPLPLS